MPVETLQDMETQWDTETQFVKNGELTCLSLTTHEPQIEIDTANLATIVRFDSNFGVGACTGCHLISGRELNQTFRNVSIVRQATVANFSGRVLRCCVGLNLPGTD